MDITTWDEHTLGADGGPPIAFALTDAKADERDTCLDMIAHASVARRGQTIIADKGYRRATFEDQLNDAGITLSATKRRLKP